MSNRKTKLIATIGPTSENEKVISKIILGGCSTVRFNFSHGDHNEQLNKLKTIQKN